MGLAVDGMTGRLTLRIDNLQCGLYLFTESVPLVHALGLPPKAIDKLDPPVYALGIVGQQNAALRCSPLAVCIQRHREGAACG